MRKGWRHTVISEDLAREIADPGLSRGDVRSFARLRDARPLHRRHRRLPGYPSVKIAGSELRHPLRRLFRCSPAKSCVTALQKRLQRRCIGVTVLLFVREVVLARLGARPRSRGRVRQEPAAVLDRHLQLIALKKDPVFIPAR